MKDINKLKNYREKYKRYYEINFGSEYSIHHIDLDRGNNDISNLLLLPKELHAKYHLILNSISICPDKPKADGFIDVRLSNILITDYNANMFSQLAETIEECHKWLEWKRCNYNMSMRKYIFGEV